MKRALAAGTLLAASIFFISVPVAFGDPGNDGGDAPRGLWCNALGILTLPGGFMVAPLNAIDV